ncbi:MAG TPA: TetR/AcrR family transcriptional regulator [Anaerolineales bacterium]|nr:TetR/AcrR family transcriptional regulator [Anaerolineales bacterium]
MQQRSEETRNRILEAATHLFAKTGYDATGVAEICQAAGVSKGAFYHHFPTKQAIFLDLLTSYLNGIEAGFNLMRAEQHNVPKVIIQMAEQAGSIFQSADIHLPIFLEFWTQANHDPQIWEAAIAPYRRYQSYFTQMIQEGIKEGSIDSVNSQLAGRVLVALAMGLLMQSLFDPQITDWQLEARQSVELLINGIARRNP